MPAPPSPASSSLPARDKDKAGGVNVQVLLRCRPFTEEELRSKTQQVITCVELRREVTVNYNSANKQIERTFTFDKVFGPQVQQKDLYRHAIAPIVTEVLEGFNCTVFAYGQTGTGKTYTMEGAGKKGKNGELPTDSGVIPRAVQQIFEILEGQNADYSMKVTFLELYNEELTDLLASEDLTKSPDERQRKPLALMEDGKGGVVVRGLEEEVVYTASDIYALLERGSAKRRTAETLLNKQSSRSHSIFSVIIHIKEATPEGEELIKCGKLNLVDLAGSENISRSGAKESRAREVGELNKSLLTLGRVITALVDHLSHIPYRDSKLTRLLRDSLGGKTKTCVIATVSPSVHCLEETLSTLDYAQRAKNIKNRPEVNQKMMKSALIKDLYLEIDRLKTEVIAAREKNGIYIPQERYFQEEAEKKVLSERLENLEFELETRDKHIEDLQEFLNSEQKQCADLTEKLESTQKKLSQTQGFLAEANETIEVNRYNITEKEYIIGSLQQSENNLIQQGNKLQTEFEKACGEITELHLKIGRKDDVETKNYQLVQKFHSDLSQHFTSLQSTISSSVIEQKDHLQQMEQRLQSFVSTKQEATEGLKKRVLSLKDAFHSGLKDLDNLVQVQEKSSVLNFQKLSSIVSAHSSSLEELLSATVSEAESVIHTLQENLNVQEAEINAFCQQQQEKMQESIEAVRGISKVTIGFFETLKSSTTTLWNSVDKSKETQQQSLEDFTRRFEEFTQNEEKHLIEKISELLAASTAQKLNLVRTRVNSLRASAEKDSNGLQNDIIQMQSLAADVNQKWQDHMTSSEHISSENIATVSARKTQLMEILQRCKKGTVVAGENWKCVQESLQNLEKENLVEVNSIVKEAEGNSGVHLESFLSKSDLILLDADNSNQSLLESMQGALALDEDAGEHLLASTATQSTMLANLQGSYEVGAHQIQTEADQCFQEDYQEDKVTCATPRRRSMDMTPLLLAATDIGHLQEEFRATHPPSLPSCNSDEENSNTTSLAVGKDIATSAKPIDCPTRIPLTTVNNI